MVQVRKSGLYFWGPFPERVREEHRDIDQQRPSRRGGYLHVRGARHNCFIYFLHPVLAGKASRNTSNSAEINKCYSMRIT